jgi:hypothetical protein
MHGLSDLESRRSKLTFVTSQDSTELTDIGHLKRIREPVSRSKSGVQGKIADVLRGRSRHAESQNELKGFRILLATGQADDWQEQPFRLEYYKDGAKHRYTPDILVVWRTHREVVEIKDDGEADLPENRKRFALIRELLADYNYYFRVWRKTEICAEPRLANVGLMLRYRSVEVSPTEREKIRRVFSFASEERLRTLCQTQGIAAQSVLRMVLDSALHINWWEPLTLASRISNVPIGPRIWPFLPFGTQPSSCARSFDAAFRI